MSKIKFLCSKACQFVSGSLIFFIFSTALIYPMGWLGEVYSEEASTILFESMAPRTIMALFVVSVVLASFSMLILGPKNKGEEASNRFYKFLGKIKDSVYIYGVLKVTEFGKSFSSASTGMLWGFAFAAWLLDLNHYALATSYLSMYLIFYWTIFDLIENFVHNGFSESLSKLQQRGILVALILAAPFVYWISYEPVPENCECVEEQSANKAFKTDSQRLAILV
ncbi:TPA: hypothetical protein ACQYBJ_004529 [Vibrio parahaemolyticus]